MCLKERARELLVRLVSIPSQPHDDKAPILDEVLPLLEALGMELHVHNGNENPAVYASNSKNPRLILNGHLDTVPRGGGWGYADGQVEGDRVYGRGALDMKGGCVSMLLAAEELASRDREFAVVLTTDEEVGMAGAYAVAEAHPEISRAGLFIICEPTGMRPVTEEKGIVQFSISTMGKSAHASMPELGKNAITDLLDRLEALRNSELFGMSQHDPVTIGIDMISGGSGINVIPDSARADIDVRFPADYSCQEMLGIMKKLVRADDGTVLVELVHELPPARSAISPELLASIEALVGGRAYSVPYGTEMAVFGALNPNIMVLGPGQSTMAHQVDEWVDINDIAAAVPVYLEIADML